MSPPPNRPIRGRLLRAVPGALGAAAALIALAPAAQAAAPKAPALTGTVPPSPATSLTPSIRGRADGIITTRTPRGAAKRVLRGAASGRR